ncbi:MAG: hypothetical protein ABI587_15190 [Gemmatimonadales bacterium]
MILPARWSRAVAFTALITLTSCLPRNAPHHNQPATIGIDPGQPGARDSVLALGQRQVYDANIGAAARTLLESDIDVTIEPMDDAYLADSVTLAQGVVVARFINHSPDSLPRLGLAPNAMSYWLIYRRDGQLFSDFVAEATDARYDRTSVPTDLHVPTRAWRQSISQWQPPVPVAGMGAGVAHLLLASGSLPWTTCGDQGCCKPPN